MSETVFSPASVLTQPRAFAREALADLRVAPEIAWHLFRSQLRARYRRSWLRWVWLLLPVIGTTLAWWYVRSRRIVDTAPTEMPYVAHVVVGMVLWQAFVEAVGAPLQQLQAAQQTITRARVPHEAFVLAGIIETVFNLAVRSLIAVAVLLYSGTAVQASALLAPAGIAAVLLFGTAVGVVLAPWGLLYDDVGRGLAFVTGLWLLVSPVLYPASGWMRWNPLTSLLETTRGWLIGERAAPEFVTVAALSALLLAVAWVVLRIARPHVVARLG